LKNEFVLVNAFERLLYNHTLAFL